MPKNDKLRKIDIIAPNCVHIDKPFNQISITNSKNSQE